MSPTSSRRSSPGVPLPARQPAGTALLALAAAVLVTGCGSVHRAIPEDPGRELTSVPFFPQTIHQCGPAALATVLGAGGIATTPEALAPLVYIPGRRGSLQVEMLAAARRHARVAYVLQPSFDAVRAELAAGTPVLVLQDLGALGVRRWHFAVVIGEDPDRGLVILRSGTRRRHVTSRDDFLRSWRPGGNWAAVVVPPSQPPATATGGAFIRALADAAPHLAAGDVAAGHVAALARWPGDPLVLFASGNDAYAAGRLDEAIGLYRRLLATEPGNAAARNNLASALLDAGCPEPAAREAATALAGLTPGSPFGDAVRDTLARASAAQGGSASACAAE